MRKPETDSRTRKIRKLVKDGYTYSEAIDIVDAETKEEGK